MSSEIAEQVSNTSSPSLSTMKGDKFKIPHPNRSIYGIIISTFFLRIAFGSTTVLMPIFIYHHLGLRGTPFYIAVIVVEITYSIGLILASGYFGFRADEDDTKKWILFGTSAGGLILIGYGICALNWDGIIGLAPLACGLLLFGMSLFHLLHGVAAACKINSSFAYISRYSVYETRARRMGLYNTAIFAGRALGVVLAGVLYTVIVGETPLEDSGDKWIPTKEYNLIYVYLLFAFCLVMSAVIVYKMVDKTKPVVKRKEGFRFKEEFKASWKIMISKERRGIILPLLGTASIIGILNNWGFIILAVDTGPDTAAYLTIIITLIMGLPMALWGYVADKIGRKKTLTIGVVGIIGMTLSMVIAYFLGYLDMNQPEKIFDNPLIAVILATSIIMSSAYAPSISGRLGDSSSIGFKEERHGATMSVQQIITAVSEIVGIVLGGVALLVAFLIDGWKIETQLIALMVPTVALILLTTVSTFLWPPEEEFIKKSKVRRLKKSQ